MTDYFPKAQQPVKSRRPSGLRNEIQADSVDEIVQVFDSEDLVPETQFQVDSCLPTTLHEMDKQSDYGGDDGFDDDDLIAHAVVPTKAKLTPTLPEWTPLTRASYQQDYESPSEASLHFTFGQPSKVGHRSTAHDDKSGMQRASPPCQQEMADESVNHPEKGMCHNSERCVKLINV